MNDGQALRAFLCDEFYPLLCREFPEHAMFGLIDRSGPEIQFNRFDASGGCLAILRVRFEPENVLINMPVKVGYYIEDKDVCTVFYEDPDMELNLMNGLRRFLNEAGALTN